MKNELRITLIQSPIIWEQPALNRNSFAAKIDTINGVDLIVLPEMFTTGFTMSPENLDVEEGGITVNWMKEMAKKTKAAIVGSIVYTENGLHYNRLFFVTPKGEVWQYDKRHTFTLAGENEKYQAGKQHLIINYKGFKLNFMICYDLRFPVWSRNTLDYDVLLYVANWPKPRIEAWDTLLKARAIENMSYCIGVNRIGSDEKGLEYVGHSAAYDALGQQLVFSEKEEILQVTIDKRHISKTRDNLKFLQDRDMFRLL
ncbi:MULTISPECIES: amidohydrolase [Maribacter]|uniref:Amidohydrolase n=1 Tax=Maribacter flavus TaxID=1658664 RepID=A0ABU7IF52_9FLAO|nr:MULTISPECIES: amidohydrolase [Maribacter]MDC6404441.1 amidohydrolase [Maribacter sp. PR66]MEE1971585.1 amidohydrolase [Maribacter flavus]